MDRFPPEAAISPMENPGFTAPLPVGTLGAEGPKMAGQVAYHRMVALPTARVSFVFVFQKAAL